MAKGKLVLCGYFLAGKKNESKYHFWLGKDKKIKELFSEVVILEHEKARETYRPNPLGPTIQVCKFLQQSLFRIKDLCYAYRGYRRFRLQAWEILRHTFAWEKHRIHRKSAGNPLIKVGLWIKFFCGMGKLEQVLREVQPSPDTFWVFFGVSTTTELLRSIAEKAGGKTVVSEYGELPGTFLVSEREILGDSWPSWEADLFNNLPVTTKELEQAKEVINSIGIKQRKGNRFSESEGLSRRVKEGLKKETVIYVNGAYEVSLGLVPNWGDRAKRLSPMFLSNKELLASVMSIAAKYGWTVVYKDHPLAVRLEPALEKYTVASKNTLILQGIELNEILDITDVMVSIGSKSVMTALAREIPVCLAGPFTISPSAISMGLYGSGDLEADLKKALLESGGMVSQEDYRKAVARLRKYYLYSDAEGSDEAVKTKEDLWHDLTAYRKGERQRVSIADEVLSKPFGDHKEGGGE